MNDVLQLVFTKEDIEPPEVDGHPREQRLERIIIVKEDDIQLLNQLDKTRSPEPERISPCRLKELTTEFAKPLRIVQ